MLSLLALVALLPPIVLLGFAVWRASLADQASANDQFLAQSRNLVEVFGSALDANATVIRRIEAISPEALSSIVKHSGSGIRTVVGRLAGSGQWEVSNLFQVEPGVSARLALTLELETTGAGTRTLTLVMDPRDLVAAMRFDTQLFHDSLVAVLDGNGRIVARSVDQDRFIGVEVPDWPVLKAVGATSGIFQARRLEGDSITFGFHLIPRTPGWAIVVGTPTATLNARWVEPLTLMLVGVLLAAATAVGLAGLVARRISRPIAALVHYARDSTGTDRPAAPPLPTDIVELESLRQGFANAHAALLAKAEHERDTASRLALSERRYRTIAEVGSLVVWRAGADGQLIEIEGWKELAGQYPQRALGLSWRDVIHPEDLPDLDQARRRAMRAGALDCECRIRVARGQWLWTRVRGGRIDDEDGRTIEWVGTIEDIDVRKREQLQTTFMALHDGLTGLPNRTLLRDHISRALASPADAGATSALLYMDLDGFKQANDGFGHDVGDTVLCLVAERIRARLRPQDLAARLGGDEFAVLVVDADPLAAASRIGNALVVAMREVFEVDGNVVELGASIGMVLLEPGASIDDIVKKADLALYQAKADGRGRLAVYGDTPARRRA